MRFNRSCLPILWLLVPLCLDWPPASAGQEPLNRPNILFLMADQFRADCVGADGNPVIRTPNLDRIAAEGARFRVAYTSTPSCTPARSGILTGLSPWHHGMLGMGRMALSYQNEMPRMLHEAGYYAAGIGKQHFHPQRNAHGYDLLILDESGRATSPDFRSDYRSWFLSMAPTLNPDATGIGWNDYRAAEYALPESLHPTRWTGDVAVNFLKEYRRPEPFFLMVSFARPHSPYDPPGRFMKMYEDADVPPAVVGDWVSRHAGKDNPEDFNSWRGNFGPEQVRASRRAYYGSVTFIDEQIGRILAILQERGWLDNTLILFTADHGDMLGDHHLWRKTYAYEASARIPMLIRWPSSINAARGQVLAQPVELRDLLPTFLDAAGATVDEKRFDGRSLLRLVRGRSDGWREYIDFEHSACYAGAGYWTALTDGRTKYIVHAAEGQEQLFDLQADPGELHDLAADPAQQDRLRAWRERMVTHLSERGEPFVKEGKLVLPRPSMLYSPNFPKDEGEENSAVGKARQSAQTRPTGRPRR
ncbi:MAG TPA: arylsulfatase [Phycisphaerae bacterium]|nr:arylsulfatase [Phycisphaerae bacterium]HRR85941.1 arylsulfatase [Phycisphaerae bacterium]